MINLNKLLVVLLLILSSCSGSSKLDSDEFSTTKERVEVLKREVVCVSAITDAEFELFNINGFGSSNGLSVPGASSSDYKFVVKVHTTDINKWIEGFTRVDPADVDNSWTSDIIKKERDLVYKFRTNQLCPA